MSYSLGALFWLKINSWIKKESYKNCSQSKTKRLFPFCNLVCCQKLELKGKTLVFFELSVILLAWTQWRQQKLVLLHSTWFFILFHWNSSLKTSNKRTARIIVWVSILCVLTLRDDRFRMKQALGVVLICCLVCAKINQGRLRSGSGAASYYWVMDEIIEPR